MIGNQLRELRIRHNLSQSELAERLKLNKKSITNWEANRADPTLENLCILSDYFRVSTEYMLGRSNEDVVFLHNLHSSDRTKLIAIIQAYIDTCR